LIFAGGKPSKRPQFRRALPLSQLSRHILGSQVRVAEQHPGVAMAADQGNFGHAQT
jgi:hypothetical protein